jgi:hypothetical protein
MIVATNLEPKVGELHTIVGSAPIETSRPGTWFDIGLQTEGQGRTARGVSDLVVVADPQRPGKEIERFERVAEVI